VALERKTWKELALERDPETGVALPDKPPVWKEMEEINATGKDCAALTGELKEAAQIQLQQAYNRANREGVDVLSNPHGVPIPVLGSQVDQYKSHGFGVAGTKPIFVFSGFGGMKKEGIIRQRTVYRNGHQRVEKTFSDGRKELTEVS
jgi:hypothetical protein